MPYTYRSPAPRPTSSRGSPQFAKATNAMFTSYEQRHRPAIITCADTNPDGCFVDEMFKVMADFVVAIH
jgi:hypothetical protein